MAEQREAAAAYRLGGRRAWLIWGIGVSAYIVAVFHRYSLGVAGVDAAQRFGVSAAVLSVFSVVQLGVYAAMQIPAGVLLDRFGSRRLIATGALVMSLGCVLGAAALALTPAGSPPTGSTRSRGSTGRTPTAASVSSPTTGGSTTSSASTRR